MANLNISLTTPKVWLTGIWTSAVGSDVNLLTVANGGKKTARRIVVGTVAGSLVLTQVNGAVVTFTANQINAQNGILDGQWTGITASGSAAYELAVGW